jgi:hypothetical protein
MNVKVNGKLNGEFEKLMLLQQNDGGHVSQWPNLQDVGECCS